MLRGYGLQLVCVLAMLPSAGHWPGAVKTELGCFGTTIHVFQWFYAHCCDVLHGPKRIRMHVNGYNSSGYVPRTRQCMWAKRDVLGESCVVVASPTTSRPVGRPQQWCSGSPHGSGSSVPKDMSSKAETPSGKIYRQTRHAHLQ